MAAGLHAVLHADGAADGELCDNLIFDRRAALDSLGERLLDANRTIGQPTTLATLFGRKVTKRYRGKLETVIEDLDLPNPVIRSYCRDGSIKQYVRNTSYSGPSRRPTMSGTSAFRKPSTICRNCATRWPR